MPVGDTPPPSKFTVTSQQLQFARSNLKKISVKPSELDKANQIGKNNLTSSPSDTPSLIHEVPDPTPLREANDITIENEKRQTFLSNAAKRTKNFLDQKIFKNSFSINNLRNGIKNLLNGLNPQRIAKHFSSKKAEETSDKKAEPTTPSKEFASLARKEKIEIAKVLIPRAVQEIKKQGGEKQEGIFRLSGRDGPQKTFINNVASDPSLIEQELEFEVTDFEGVKSKVKPSADDLAGLIKKTISQLLPQTISLTEETKALLTPEQLKSYEESKEAAQLGEEEKAILKESLQPLYELFVEIDRNQEKTKLTWNTLSISAPEIFSLMRQVGFVIPKNS